MEEHTLTRTKIVKYPFSVDGAKLLKEEKRGSDWPVVYILKGTNLAYVGETSNAFNRMLQHLDNPTRNSMVDEYVFFNDTFNKSAILDIENMLIEHMHADGKFILQNLNNGQSKFHNYYQRGLYKELFQDIWKQLRKQKLASHTLYQVENSEIFKYSPFKQLTDEQYNLEMDLLSDIADAVTKKQHQTIIVEGGAGTGKSILAISLIKYLADVAYQKIDYSDIDFVESLENTINFIEINKKLAAHPKESYINYV